MLAAGLLGGGLGAASWAAFCRSGCPVAGASEEETRRRKLHALLQGPQTWSVFGEIISLFESWPAGAAREEATEEAAVALESWPDDQRLLYLSDRFLDRNPMPRWVRLIRTVYLFATTGAEVAPRLAQAPALAGLTGITVAHRDDSEDDVHVHLGVLARSPYLRSIRRLSVIYKRTYSGEWSEVAQSPVFAQLEELRIRRVYLDVPAEEFASVIRGNGRSLRRLDLDSWNEHLVETILTTPSLVASLRDLTLEYLRDRDAAALVAASDLRSLETLELRSHTISQILREQLRRAPQFARTRLLIEEGDRR